jgi:hypothetical protein
MTLKGQYFDKSNGVLYTSLIRTTYKLRKSKNFEFEETAKHRKKLLAYLGKYVVEQHEKTLGPLLLS